MKKLEELGIFPGPWECRGLRSDWILGPNDRGYANNIIVRSERLGYRSEEPDEFHYANMRLIAAAPDMYDVLQRILELRDEQVVDNYNEWLKRYQTIMNDAVKALSKAAGEDVGE